jgi:2-keto-3-deoxy-L-rhamnonate aldolase RhmA
MKGHMNNSFSERLKKNGFVKIISLRQIKTADIVYLVKESGFDGFYIDAEHGIFSLREISDLSLSATSNGLISWVRVPEACVSLVGPILDAGATGIIFPHVSDAQEAAKAVQMCKYPPLGKRSMAALSAASLYHKAPAQTLKQERDDAVFVIAMIETALGVENAQGIANVPGVDALMMGPMDLSFELGVPGQTQHSGVTQATLKAAKAAQSAGKHFVVGEAGHELADQLRAMGAKIFTGGSDGSYLLGALTKAAMDFDAKLVG